MISVELLDGDSACLSTSSPSLLPSTGLTPQPPFPIQLKQTDRAGCHLHIYCTSLQNSDDCCWRLHKEQGHCGALQDNFHGAKQSPSITTFWKCSCREEQNP
ncbi:Hypothetical predicted protein [Podarcis lilfordi]|uniref:Uncharacterized protein n=1 Tax=Podarcis lilfordi TaxID=74358 RepID=A0AA35P587_9SAUR|nr:Hypothetical predicted protein [Podarcis lilfordi]